MNKTNLQEMVWAITYRCNSRCRMCNIWQIDDHQGELQVQDIKKFPESMTSLNISGGEPFLRSDLVEIIRKIKTNNPNLSIIISTNGFASDLIKKQMEEILKIDPGIGIAFSLDGVAEMHEEVRNITHAYDKVLDSINKLKILGVKNLRIGFTMGDYNTIELKKVYELSEELGMEMSLAVVHSSDNFFNAKNSLDKKEEMIKELEWLKAKELSTWKPKNWARAYFAHGMIHYLETGKRLLPDYSGLANLFMDPRGDVFPCDVSSEKLGNIKNEDIEKIRRKPKDRACMNSWMICTARPAIKKHKLIVLAWILAAKIKSILNPTMK